MTKLTTLCLILDDDAAVIDKFLQWIMEFGSGWAGLAALGIVCLMWAIIKCAPPMYASRCDVVKEREKRKVQTKKIDLEIIKRLEKIAGAGKGLRVEPLSSDSEK